jgi:hypothetical protein
MREEQRRHVPDRAPIKAFATALRKECDQLERLYESHLRRIAEGAPIDDDFAIREQCENVVGILQFSVIHLPSEASRDRHVYITPTLDAKTLRPVPYIQNNNKIPTAGRPVPLSEQIVFSEEPVTTADWIDAPGHPMVFWVRRSASEAVVFHIDRERTMETIETTAKAALVDTFSASPQDAWQSPSGEWIGSAPVANSAPDFLLPVQTRFGTWEIASWDAIELEMVYDPPFIVSAAVLAALLGGCGFIAFLYQRRSIRQAEQRVSFVNRVSHELRTPPDKHPAECRPRRRWDQRLRPGNQATDRPDQGRISAPGKAHRKCSHLFPK